MTAMVWLRALATCGLENTWEKGNMSNEVFSVLINGGPRWLCHKRTYAINDPFL